MKFDAAVWCRFQLYHCYRMQSLPHAYHRIVETLVGVHRSSLQDCVALLSSIFPLTYKNIRRRRCRVYGPYHSSASHGD